MTFRRLTGWLLLFVAGVLLGAEALMSIEDGRYSFLALGQIWYMISADSLNLVQAGIQRHIHPLLWEPIITTLLRLPGWLLPGALGGVFLYLGRNRRRRIFTHRRRH